MLTKDQLFAMTPAERAALDLVVVSDCTRCTDCADCIGIEGGQGLRYVAWGVQLTREEYEALK